jgi:hypothetical protein
VMNTRIMLQLAAIFVCLCPSLVSHAAGLNAVRRYPASELMTRLEVERMTASQFFRMYGLRAPNALEPDYDEAAFYYVQVKSDLHDRLAAEVSPQLFRKVRWIRSQIFNAEKEAVDLGDAGGMGTMYTHMVRVSNTDREDAVGDILASLRSRSKVIRSTKRLLRRLALLDQRLPGRRRPYHKLAKSMAGMPYDAVKSTLNCEQRLVHLIVFLRHEMHPD